jgi:CubicO group peptidase (beta-lactamase class C family)
MRYFRAFVFGGLWLASTSFGYRHPSGWEIEPKAMQSPACRLFETYSFHSRGNPLLKNGVETDGVVVVKEGVVRYHRYAAPFNESTPHILWSASKTINYTLVGNAIQEGLIRATDPISDFYPASERLAANKNEHEREYTTITIQDLVNNGGGFFWNESYEAGLTQSSVIQMLYFVPGIQDMALFASRAPMTAREPDGKWKWVYSSGKSNLLAGILRKAYQMKLREAGEEKYDRLPWTSLFDKLNLSARTAFEQDAAGVFVGSSSAHLTPLDMAKFGWVNLNQGQWENVSVIPNAWANAAHEIVDEYKEDGTKITNTRVEGVAGPGGWWLNKPAKGLDRPYPQSPPDMYAAMGHFGQYIVVIPSKKMVLVRTAEDHDPHAVDFDRWVSAGVACFTDTELPQTVTLKSNSGVLSRIDTNGLRQKASDALRYVKNLRGKKIDWDDVEKKAQGYLEIAKFAVEKALLNKMFAQDLCSCIHVTQFSPAQCEARVMYPFTDLVLSRRYETGRVRVTGSLPKDIEQTLSSAFPNLDLNEFKKDAIAELSSKGTPFGCHLVP